MKRLTGQRGEGEGEGWRPRAGLAAVVAVCVAVTGIAVSGAGNAAPGLRFAEQGQWIYNSTIGAILHVNGSTKNVDGQIPLPGAGPGTQVIESDKNGYVLARGGIHPFGKSDLQVLDPQPAPVDEQAIGLSAGSAVFAVYRNAGSIVRLGEHPAVDTPGVPLGQPVVTSTGTLWVHRPDNGQLCQLPLDADRLSCPAKAPLGHSGALTVVGDDQVVFVDTTGRAMYAVAAGGLGRQVPLPVADLPASSVITANDVAGRVAIVDPERNVLHLVGTGELTGGKADQPPVEKPLRKGRYERIASSGNSLALIDDSTDTLLTVDRDGNETGARRIPPPSKKAKAGKDDRSGLYRGGDARLYVVSRSGEQVMVVEDTGEVAPVDTSTARPDETKTPKPGTTPTARPSEPAQRPTQPPPTQPPPTQPPPTQPEPTQPEPTQPKPTQPKPTQPPPTTERPPTEPPATQPTKKREQPKPQDPRTSRPREEPTGQPSSEPTRRPDNTPSPKPSEPASPPPKKPDPEPTVAAGRPGAPRSVSGKAGTSSALVSWEPAAANGAAITAYRVSWNGGSLDLAASVRSTNVTGLTNGTGYTFTVRAVNRVGAGPGSSTARLVPDGGAADAPADLTVAAGNAQVRVTWARPNLHGNTFHSYRVTATATGSSSSGSVTGTSHTFTDLDAGKTYRVTVAALTTDAQGKRITGKAASRTVTLGGSSSVARLVASRGPATTHGEGEDACEAPGCAFIKVVGTNLKPDTDYFFQPFTTRWRPSNPGATLRTESDGSIEFDDRFATDAPGQQVWVVATADGEEPVVSDKFTWRTP